MPLVDERLRGVPDGELGELGRSGSRTTSTGRAVGAVQREGRTLIPTKLYFNDKGRVKLEVAMAKGKKIHDKRAVEADRDWKREQGRLMRERG